MGSNNTANVEELMRMTKDVKSSGGESFWKMGGVKKGCDGGGEELADVRVGGGVTK